ncbi:MFS transporter [Rhizobium leguminosarum]|uniref:MFS transporter n=1 Tax=Rhizobium leguminosarum TaxID=384 RepID=UPI003F967718
MSFMNIEHAEPSLHAATERRSSLRLLALVSIGGALEFYDFIIFIFLAPIIGAHFFPPGTSDWVVVARIYGIFGLGYLVRPMGGIVLAHFGDLFGRRRTFIFSILLMAISTIGIAILPTYQSIGVAAPILLVVYRLMQGAAIGGEVPGAWTFISEHLPIRSVGFGCGILCAGLGAGIWLGASLTAVLDTVMSEDAMMSYGWRIPFVLGGVFGLVAVYLRVWLRETPIFSKLLRQRLLVPEFPLRVVIREHIGGVVISILLTWYLSASIVVSTLMMPALLIEIYGYTSHQALITTSFGTFFVAVGAIFAGRLIDRIGVKPFFVLAGLTFAATTTVFYTCAQISMGVAMPLYAIMGLAIGMNAGVPYLMVRSFPARVRCTGVSFSYNISYAVFGGLTPVLITALLPYSSLAHLYYMLLIAAVTFGVGLYLLWSRSFSQYPAGIEEGQTLTAK